MATSSAVASESLAFNAYESLAPFYDEFTSTYPHDSWVGGLERLARRHGARGHRVLDVAGGTGKSALPLQALGYGVTVCDISPAMAATARRRLRLGADRCFVADMRELPPIGPFDLALCLDDALNYLVTTADLEAALRSIRRTLRPGGMLLFDVNSIATYSSVFGGDFWRHGGLASYHWTGRGPIPARPGEVFSADIEIVCDGSPSRRSVHVQRHHPAETIIDALSASGLRCAGVYGQSSGGRLSSSPDEERHGKVVYVVRRPSERRQNR